MAPLLSKPSSAAPTALFYVTVGALLTVWGIIWLAYLHNHPPKNDVLYYIDYLVFSTGIVLLGIGIGTGRISRAAREAELPPKEATDARPAGSTAPPP